MKRKWWQIDIHGYGDFAYFGTEDEAEGMRRHKANWEGGVGTKRPATKVEEREGRKFIYWQRKHGYPLDERELAALV